MKRYFIILAFLFAGSLAISQSVDTLTGVVSYRNAQNVYVKFNNTSGISVGDTLFVLRDDILSPALVVGHTSSLSVVGAPIGEIQLNVKDEVVFRSGSDKVPFVASDKPAEERQPPVVPEVPPVPVPEVEKISSPDDLSFHENIRGRLSASLYSNILNSTTSNLQRMRYTFSVQAKNINDSRFSAETYISYRHQLEDWRMETTPLSKALRVYSLALTYQAGDNTVLALGRKVNSHITNIGALDGLQAEHTSGGLTYGGFGGSRPDHTDYGLNPDLMQVGAFVALRTDAAHGTMQNSLALVEQRNRSMTDRRFAYLQHSSSLIKNIYVFSSFEVDLYERPDSVSRSTFKLTSTYVSLQYRPSRKWTLFGSYDARKNVIYYETYRNFIDNLLEQETRQGLRFRVSYRPVKYVTLGSSIGYRFQKDQGSNSMNTYHYITHSRVPWINASVTASAVQLKNDYLHGIVYGVRMSRDVFKQKVYGQLEFRRVDYIYGDSERSLKQNIVGADLSWRLQKTLSLSVNYEGVFEQQQSNNRIHVNIMKRF